MPYFFLDLCFSVRATNAFHKVLLCQSMNESHSFTALCFEKVSFLVGSLKLVAIWLPTVPAN